MPVGLEMLGRPFAESRLLALAYAFEQATGHRRPPDVSASARQSHSVGGTPVTFDSIFTPDVQQVY